MKRSRITSQMGSLLAWVLAANAWSALAGSAIQADVSAELVRFAVISDPHLYNARLGTSGSAYELYLLGDPKLIKESRAILEAALARIGEEHVQFLIITGDLTKDGEVADHVLMAQHLRKLEQQGVQVFVVPGNHDINNPYAVKYVGDGTRPVPNTSSKTFQAIYHNFGYGKAVARDSCSLSYVAEPVPGLWLLAIDSCKYQENLELGTPVVSGRISAQTMGWILATLEEARARGKQVMAFMHHGVNQHFLAEPALFPEYLLDDWPTVSAQLAATGLRVVFTGHYHSQDAAYPVNEALESQLTLCDVETGSLAQFPCAFRIVTLEESGSLNIRTERVTEIDADTGGLPFQQYAEVFLRTHMAPLVVQQLMVLLRFSEPEAIEHAPWVIDALVANYVGDEAPSAETLAKIQEYMSSADPREQNLGMLLAGIWSELFPTDNNLVIPFAPSGDYTGRPDPGGPVTPPETPPRPVPTTWDPAVATDPFGLPQPVAEN
jgi:3',5'-cyclic AMP phosphodiesterase CpdA